MCSENVFKNYNKFPFILVKNSTIIETNRQFVDLSGFTYEEIIKQSIEDVFRNLRVGSNVDIDKIDEGVDHFLFTKALEAKFVNIKVVNGKEEKVYFFLEKTNFSLEAKFPFLNELFLNNYYGIGIYSMPDMTLLKANEKYLSFKDEPYNRKENCLGKHISEFEMGFKGGPYEDVWKTVIKTGKTYNIEEYRHEGFNRGTTYWRLSLIPVHENDELKYCVVMTIEITEQVLHRKTIEKQARAIEKQKNQLQAIIDNMSDNLMVFDKYGKYILKNKVAIDRMYAGPYNTVGDSYKPGLYFDLEGNEIPITDIPAMSVLNGRSITDQIICVKTSEEEKYISVSGTPLYGDNGEFLMGIVCTRDITESESKNKIINQQKVQLETIMNNMGDLLFVIDSKGNYVYINKLAESYFDEGSLKKYQDIQSKTEYMDLNKNVIPEQDLPYYTVLRTKEIYKRTIIMKRREQERYLQVTAVPVIDSKRNINIVISIATDVTEHIKHSKIIQQQKEELETIIENMSEGLMVVDKNRKYTRINKKVRQYIQASNAPDIVANSIGDSIGLCETYYDTSGKLLSVEDFPAAKVIRGEKIKNKRIIVKRGDTDFYFDFSGNPIFDDNGEVRLGVILIRDISEQVKSQNLIVEQKEQLQAVIDNMSDALFIINPDGSYKYYNKRALDMTYKGENIKRHGESAKYTKHYDMNGRKLKIEDLPSSEVLRGKKVENVIVKTTAPDKTRYVSVNGSPAFDDNGNMISAIVCVRDMTEYIEKEQALEENRLKLLQAEIEKNQTLMKSIEMKDEFLSFISHEFRTPLNVINTAIQAMNYICGNELSDRAKKYLGMIKQNTFRQLRLVNNLLDITRADAGRIKVNKKNIDIVFLTKAITDSVYNYASNKGVKLNFVSSFKKKVIGIDDEKYERILLNLLSNAIKFTPEGNFIIVSLRSIKNNICIKVKDTGIGIPTNKIDVIFERFGQVDSSLSRQAEGTGIGLSLVKRFVEALGGSISVKSKVGIGSTFTILLPNERIIEEQNEKEMINLLDNRLIETTTVEFSDIYL